MLDCVSATLARTGSAPALHAVRDFHDHPAYIRALGDLVRDYWRANGRPETLVMSFHGLPQRTVDRGDPYQRQCEETARLLAAVSRASLRQPYSLEVPNVWVQLRLPRPRLSLRGLVHRVRPGLATSLVLVLGVLTLGGCSSEDVR